MCIYLLFFRNLFQFPEPINLFECIDSTFSSRMKILRWSMNQSQSQFSRSVVSDSLLLVFITILYCLSEYRHLYEALIRKHDQSTLLGRGGGGEASYWTICEIHLFLKIRQMKTEFSWVHSVVCDSLRPHGLQHARLPCPSPTPGVYSSSCPLSHDAIQPSHPLLSPSPPTFNLSQHQGLFQWVSSSRQVAKVLEFQLQHQSFQWIFRIDFL